MRKEETPLERASLQLLATHLASTKDKPQLVNDRVSDKPDGLFQTESSLFACECTQIPPSYIYRHFAGKDKSQSRPEGEIKSVCWPLEPHIWVRDAIIAKQKLIDSYQVRTNADEVWLLIHTPPKSGRDFVDLDKSWISDAISLAATSYAGRFDRIYYASFPNDLRQVWPAQSKATSIEQIGIDFTHGYPCLHTELGVLKFSTTKATTSRPSSAIIEHNTRRTTVVRPKCPVYKRFEPAIRQPIFRFRIEATHCEARVQMFINWQNMASPSPWIPQKIQHISPLQPDTAYNFAYLFMHDTH